ncbi:MAG: glycosyl hydrolase [Phycisphaerae bacterium]|nr:glycosyl hydrolase [Phycisphaerae bacterium]
MNRTSRVFVLGLLAVGLVVSASWALKVEAKEAAAAEDDGEKMKAETFAGLKFRGIGPGMSSGRIGDFAVSPRNRAHYFVAVASGGVWKTENGGTTFTPVFDGEGSFSIGCVTMDPHNDNVVWVGTGENNSQRSVDFGDGVYRTLDGGKSWENMGLRESEHIGMIAIDPRDSNVVYVAAQGPLWNSGGDRGLYKTTDGGKNWMRVLNISEDTGVNEVHLDPRDPDVIYASAYQRRRHVWTLINGGPESALYKSTDAGKTWRKLTKGLPDVDKGRIGLCIAPADPDVVYAIVEAADDKGGFFRSTDRGESWTKQNKYMSSSPQYYNELVCDPLDVGRVYSLDTFMHVTEDGGKTFQRAPREDRHVDDHALWIDPHDTSYHLVGCDGGVYESFDRGQHWRFMANLPVTQFYRVAIDNGEPFYYVYGGTQDNNTLGGPSRTLDRVGIVNGDWFVTVGGDGFKAQVDPKDPNIVYSQWQYGGLVRYDRRSGERVDIKPREAPGEDPLRWNWDSPLIISPHDHERLYFAAQKLYRSDDRGNSWTAISGDLSRKLDRNQLKVMGKLWSVDAVAKNASTSFYGNCVSLDESPMVEGLIYVGTDDGLVHVTEDGGKNWRTISVFPRVPDQTYVSGLTASRHDADTVFALFDNHKNGDFKPYVLKSTDRGATWTSIAGDLPNKDYTYVLREDPVLPELLFVGTEFGVYFTRDGGQKWIKLKGGIPTIAVRDMEIQERENDLVLATFGRGFYILDDYTPLRATPDILEKDAAIYPIKPALRYIERNRLGGREGRGWQGAAYFAAPNPPFGAVFTVYLKEKIKTLKEERQEAEKKAVKAGKEPKYPSYDDLRAEDREEQPQVVLVVQDQNGGVIRRLPVPREKGIHRVSWDLRYPSADPIELKTEEAAPWDPDRSGPLALPGTYQAFLALSRDGEFTAMTEPQSFEVVALENATLPAPDQAELLAFQKKVAELQRVVRGTAKVVGEMKSRMTHAQRAVLETPGADASILTDIEHLQTRLADASVKLTGDPTLRGRDEPSPLSIMERTMSIVYSSWYSTSAPTQTQREDYKRTSKAFADLLSEFKSIDRDLSRVEEKLEQAGAPWTPGRLPDWNPQ